MVPDKFNMVDMEGIDIITSQGEEIPGLYQKLVESIAQCRYQCIYNWKFDGILIPPTYVEMTIIDDVVWINEGVSVDEEDVIRIYSLEPPAPEPQLTELTATANGNYLPTTGYDGFSSVEVAVPAQSPVLTSLSVTSNGTYTPPTGVDGYDEVVVDVPSSGQSDAIISYDFTKCAGEVFGVTYNSSGAVFPSGSGGAHIPLPVLKNDITIYVDVGNMNLSSGSHRRFIMRDASSGFIYRSNGVWALFVSTWEESQITDGSIFANSKVKVYIDSTAHWHIYKDGILLWEPTLALSLTGGLLQLGSSTGSVIVNSILTGCRIYNGNYTE